MSAHPHCRLKGGVKEVAGRIRVVHHWAVRDIRKEGRDAEKVIVLLDSDSD